jgi:16S rRNA (cytosine1402-N4)-methyltransferase
LEIAKRLTNGGRLIALDRDPDAIAVATERLKGYNATVLRCNYSQIKDALESQNVQLVDGILMDLGVSSHQLDTAERGFSYHYDAPLDMRMSQSGVSAFDVVNQYSYEQLVKVIFEFGEEKFASKVASNIVKTRENAPIETTLQLAEVIKSSIPAKFKRDKNPCKKTFQAIRMEVNGELEHLSLGLDDAFYSLKIGGRLAVITFHSLEDRLVKQRFASWCKGCICPPDFPQCVCGKKPQGKLVNRKPIEANALELEQNNRSRSAKLRVIERI